MSFAAREGCFHGSDRDGRRPARLPGPWGVSTSRNITSDKEKGLGSWSDAEIKRAITTGVTRNGDKLSQPMGYASYAKMTDKDMSDLIAYLRTVPAKQ